MSVSIMGFNFPPNYRVWKIIAALKIAGISYKFVPLEYAVDNESPEYMANCSPMGRTPVLQTEDGYIFESHAILRHIARADKTNSFLYGRTTYEAAQVDQWLDYASEFNPAGYFLMTSVFGAPASEEARKKALEETHAACAGLDKWLETRTYLAGERLTVADLGIAGAIDIVFRWTGPNQEDFTKKYKNAFRHYNTVVNHPKFVEALQENNSFVGLPKVEKPKKEEPKKEKKKEEKKEQVLEDDGDDLLMDEKPKEKNPLDLLPPSKFVLDAFKREYSNKDTRKEAAPYFFQNFDAAGYTAFWCKYKYNEELAKAFMTSNLVRGWFQRMDHIRKYAFGTVLIVGEEGEGKSEIQGFFFFRGDGMPQIVKDVDDVDLYEWTQIKDIHAEKDKITDFLAWDGDSFAKMPVLEGRCYK